MKKKSNSLIIPYHKSYKNIFDDGGILGVLNGEDIVDGVIGAAGALTPLIATNLQGADYKNIKAQDVNALSKSDLLNQAENFEGYNLGREGSGTTIQGGLSGLQAGASLGGIAGPLGAGIGAGAGLLTGGLFGGIGRRRRNKARARKEKELNGQTKANFETENNRLTAQGITNSLTNYFAYGGDISNGLVEFNSGGSHEDNPLGGIPQGMSPIGEPNFVEEGETKFNDFIFSDRLKVDTNYLSKYNLPKAIRGKTYADASKYLAKESEERENDPISKRGLEVALGRLEQSQEDYKDYLDFEQDFNEESQMLGLEDSVFAKGGKIHIKKENRGKFTASAKRAGMGVQEFASKVLANKDKYSSTLVKRANFAKNASKWNHAYGGLLALEGYTDLIDDPGDTTTTILAEGGLLNLRNVQNRFSVYPDNITTFDFGGPLPKQHASYYKLGKPHQGAFVYAYGGPEEFISDPYGFNYRPSQAREAALALQGLGRTPGYQPYSGLMVNPDVEFDDLPPVEVPSARQATRSARSTQPDIINYQDPIGAQGLVGNNLGLTTNLGNPNPVYGNAGGPSVKQFNQKNTQRVKGTGNNLGSQLAQFAPALANLGLLISDASSRPETVNLGRMDLSRYMLNEDLPYRPVDREYIANRVRSQAGAQRRASTNTSGGNRATALANLAGANSTALRALGDAYSQTDEINYNRRLRGLEFRNNARQFNAQLAAQQQGYNLGASAQEQQINAANRAARRNAIRQGTVALGENLGQIGRYLLDRRTISNTFPLYDFLGRFTGGE